MNPIVSVRPLLNVLISVLLRGEGRKRKKISKSISSEALPVVNDRQTDRMIIEYDALWLEESSHQIFETFIFPL